MGPVYFRGHRFVTGIISERSNFTAISDIKSVSAVKGWYYSTQKLGGIQQRLPSKSLPDDALLLLRIGTKLVKEHIGSKQLRNTSRGEMVFSQLYSVVRYPVPETFICEIPDAFIHAGDGVIVTRDYEVLLQSAVRGIAQQVVPMRKIPKIEKRLPGTYVSLLGWSSRNYSHWLMDIMPRLSALGDMIHNVRFLVSEPLASYQKESLALWGIPESSIVPVKDGWYRVENMLLAYAAERSSITHKYHMNDVRATFLQKVYGAEYQPKPWRKVYISRSNARRKIVNEREIIPLVQNYGFEIINCEDLTFLEQVKLFSETDVVLGAHGSGMNNQIFGLSGMRVIEIYNPAWLNHCICITSSVLDNVHWHTLGENVDKNYNTKVDIRKIDKLLSYIFENPNGVEELY